LIERQQHKSAQSITAIIEEGEKRLQQLISQIIHGAILAIGRELASLFPPVKQ
jgi:hypothetical protein